MTEDNEQEWVAEQPGFPTAAEEAIMRWYLDEVGTITLARGRGHFNEQMKKWKAWHKKQRDAGAARFKSGWSTRHMIQQYLNTGKRMRRRYEEEHGATKWPRLPGS